MTKAQIERYEYLKNYKIKLTYVLENDIPFKDQIYSCTNNSPKEANELEKRRVKLYTTILDILKVEIKEIENLIEDI